MTLIEVHYDGDTVASCGAFHRVFIGRMESASIGRRTLFAFRLIIIACLCNTIIVFTFVVLFLSIDLCH